MVTCAPTACKHKVSGSVSLPSRGSFHLSLTVLFAIGHRLVFRLGGWALRLHTGLHVSGTTLVSLGPLQISPTGVSPSMLCFSKTVRLSVKVPRCDPQPRSASTPVWPLPRSLAATWRIDVSFSSWGYLDVSVHPVSFCMLCVHMQMHTHCSMRVPPFGNLRFIRYLLLTAAYRSLSRPSSASGAKASALCSFLLDQIA